MKLAGSLIVAVLTFTVVVSLPVALAATNGTGPQRETAATAAAQDPARVEAPLALDRPARRLIQQRLRNEGFNPGVPFGPFGPRPRAAICDWQQSRGASPTGCAEAELLRTAAAPPPAAPVAIATPPPQAVPAGAATAPSAAAPSASTPQAASNPPSAPVAAPVDPPPPTQAVPRSLPSAAASSRFQAPHRLPCRHRTPPAERRGDEHPAGDACRRPHRDRPTAARTPD